MNKREQAPTIRDQILSIRPPLSSVIAHITDAKINKRKKITTNTLAILCLIMEIIIPKKRLTRYW